MLAATGAARGSAGYVTVALPAPLLGASDAVPEVMGVGLTDNAGFHCLAGIDRLMERAQRAGSMVIGPGIGRTHSASAFVLAAIESIGAPLVIDADALHAFSGSAERIARRRQPTVLTPHSGEMASLLGIGRDEVEARRLSCARLAAQKSRAVVVLKGDDTIIASPEGQVGVSRGDSPALATAGSGDVLGGLVAALLAHSVDPFTAACAAVLMHTEAGRIAASGGAEGVIATDIAAMLPTARKQLALRAYG